MSADATPGSGAQVLPQGNGSDAQPITFPIVGIGASAGGLAAFEAFFSGMPTDTDPGMAIVLVQHLAPDHKSILGDLIRRCTRMPVFEAEDGMPVQVNCVYIIPPNHDLALLQGRLQLFEPSSPRGWRLPIDFFLNSLARDQHQRAIAIVLSGTGSDGSEGVRAIKSEGGMVMAQSLASAEFDGMPRSAIGTGMVDFELPAEAMAAQVMAYVAHPGARSGVAVDPETRSEPLALHKVFVLLRAHTGHDFSQYKPSTVHRRVERRMAVHRITTIDDYARYMQATPTEADALLGDLLIGVTRFFRDPAAFAVLEQRVIPALLKDRDANDCVRVWSPGCSCGEEAYSIAILLHEQLAQLQLSCKVQVFASDIDRRAIARARTGVYPASIANDVSAERLARYFTAEADGSRYRIHKCIRDLLVFSEHDVIKDPPFSRLDLISCRNLLIYMGSELQKRLIPMFHYILKPSGVLFLGTSETVGEFGDLFAPIDHTAKLYLRKQVAAGTQRAARGLALPAMGSGGRISSPVAGRASAVPKVSLREQTEQALLRQMAGAGVLVNGHGDMLYTHGRTGMYLELMTGEAGINNIVKMAREGLRHDLASALHQAMTTRAPVRRNQLRVRSNGHFVHVDLGVLPLLPAAEGDAPSPLFLVTLETVSAPVAAVSSVDTAPPGTSEASSARTPPFDQATATATIADLNEALRANREYLQSANAQLETSNEALKASNDEMQSINEELQSTNEELETSKEEMQSINEELATVNSELQTKVTDLSRASNDMNNLLSCTGIGTIFVDHQLRVLRFTPAVTGVINLIPSDVGRPVAHIVSNLVDYVSLVADAQCVLDTLVPKEVEVRTTADTWYTLRIQPYRTLDNVIEGAVITFVEITGIVRAREALSEANELRRLAVVVRDASDAITVQDLDGRITAWNPSASRMYGWTEAEALLLNVRARIPAELQEGAQVRVRRLSQDEVLAPNLTWRLDRDGKRHEVWVTSTALVDAAGLIYAIATTERLREPSPSDAGGHDVAPR